MPSLREHSAEVHEQALRRQEEQRLGTVTLTLALCFTLGWQGGTVHQVAAALHVDVRDILNAGDVKAGDLLRKAQAVKWEESRGDVNRLLLKHLNICVGALKADYNGHDTPPWLERAAGVAKIASESVID